MAKKKKIAQVVNLPRSTEAKIRSRARSLDIEKCYINKDWKKIGEAFILIIRRHKEGGRTLGSYVVNLSRGLLETSYEENMVLGEYEGYMHDYLSDKEHMEAEYALVHKIIYGAIDYSEHNDLIPHEDFEVSQYILEEEDYDDDDIPDIGFGGGEFIDPTHDPVIDPSLYDQNKHYEHFRKYVDLICALPDITAEGITSEYRDDYKFDDLIGEWEIEDWEKYFKKNSGKISLQFLEYVVFFAWDYNDTFLDDDHYKYHFNRKSIKRKTRHAKLDEMNRLANAALSEGRIYDIPGIYEDKYTFRDLFPGAKTIPITSVAEMCRIYMEYYTVNSDITEALSYYIAIQLLVWDGYSEQALVSFKKLIVKAIQDLKTVFSTPGDQADNIKRK